MVLQELQGIATAFAVGIDRLTSYWAEERKASDEKRKNVIRVLLSEGLLPQSVKKLL